MKILQVISSLSAEGGGPIEGLIQQGMVMTQYGHDVQTLCLDAPGSSLDTRLGSSAVYQLGPNYLGYGFVFRLEPWLRENGLKFDVIIVHGLWQYHGYSVSKVARELGLTYVVFLHGMLDPWFARRYPLKHLKKWLYWPWAEYRVLRDANLVLFTTAEELLLARQSFWLYRVRERLVGYGIKAPDVQPVQARSAFLVQFPHLKGKRNLLYLSRIHPKKGCDLLIHAFAKVAVADLSLHLIMAGPGEASWVRELKQLADALGLAHRVTFTGMIKDEVKWGAYDVADAFVLPSHQENFGIVVAEALAWGVPVLTTYQVNIWREIQESGAGIIHADSQAGADQLLADWLELSPIEQSTMRVKAKLCFAKNFEIKQVTEHLINALDDVKNKGREVHTFKGSSLFPTLITKFEFVNRHSSFLFYLLMLPLIAWLDLWTGREVNLWLLYCIPMSLATWNLGLRQGYAIAICSTITLFSYGIYYENSFKNMLFFTISYGSKFIIYFVLTHLLGQLRKKEVDRVVVPNNLKV